MIMGQDEPTRSWKRGKGFCEGEMETAFLVILNFCVQVMGPPRCGHIEDERGPYSQNGSVNGPTVRGTQVNDREPIGKTMKRRTVRQ